MDSTLLQFCFIIMAVLLWQRVDAHGRLFTPAARGTMWRKGFNTPHNYNDNQMFCGGFMRQVSNGYKCGMCGDPYDSDRPHEAGGKYATGTIAETYNQGQEAVIQVQLTANHKGWFEFKICPTEDPTKRATQDCLDQYALQLSDGSGSKLYVEHYGSTMIDIPVYLPTDLVCEYCVLQWHYHAGNSEGTGSDGVTCIGCGMQEEFYGCADIRILPANGNPPTRESRPSTEPATTTATTTTTTTTTATTESNNGGVTDNTDTENGGSTGNNGNSGNSGPGTNTNGGGNTNGGNNVPMIYSCTSFRQQPGMDTWCNNMCAAGSCNTQLCSCERIPDPRFENLGPGCYATSPFASRPGMDGWCSANCALNNCPPNMCFCLTA